MRNSDPGLPPPPLVVDLDGTLTPTDTLWESLVRLVKLHPGALLSLPFWLLRGRAHFKERVARSAGWSGEGVPLREELLAYLQEQKKAHRKIVLATAAHAPIAETIAKRVGLFDAVIASDGRVNLKGRNKLDAIKEKVGERFVYAGDSRADIPIWSAAEGAILVGTSAALRRTVAQLSPLEREFGSGPGGWRLWLRAIRVHQWLKNILIFVPLLTSFSLFDDGRLGLAALAFIAFSLAASATYLINDLWDLDSDRSHPRKRDRPLASGAIGIPQALVAAVALMLAASAVALAVGYRFAFLLLVYVVLTSAYSWTLRRFVVLDVLTLACLYMIRIVSGAVAIGVAVSSWLLAFSGFLFFGLALVKRCAELVTLGQNETTASTGRNYYVSDLRVLWPMGVGASMCSVVVFGLFISWPDTGVRYASPELIWLAALGLIYWLARLWIKTSRGEMHDDPMVFAARDLNSRINILIMVLITLISYFVDLDRYIPWVLGAP